VVQDGSIVRDRGLEKCSSQLSSMSFSPAGLTRTLYRQETELSKSGSFNSPRRSSDTGGPNFDQRNATQSVRALLELVGTATCMCNQTLTSCTSRSTLTFPSRKAQPPSSIDQSMIMLWVLRKLVSDPPGYVSIDR
jgi:hypothetical protein